MFMILAGFVFSKSGIKRKYKIKSLATTQTP